MRLLPVLLLLTLPAHAGGVPADKQGHIAMGLVTYGACRVLEYPPETCLGAAVSVGVAKEAMDATDKKHHSVEFLDFAATATGGLLMFTFERAF